MPPKKLKQGRNNRTKATIRLSPFRLTVKPAKNGFVCEFTGMIEGEKIEIELEFPLWWAAEMIEKLAAIKIRGGT